VRGDTLRLLRASRGSQGLIPNPGVMNDSPPLDCNAPGTEQRFGAQACASEARQDFP